MSQSDYLASEGHNLPSVDRTYSSLPEVDRRREIETGEKQLSRVEGKEIVHRDNEGLQVVTSPDRKLAQSFGIEVTDSSDKEATTGNEYCGNPAKLPRTDPDDRLAFNDRRRRRWVWVIAVLALCLIVGVGLGVGLGIGLKSNAPNQTQPGVNPNSTDASGAPTYLSTSGAFNGSSIAVRRQNDLLNLTSGEIGTSNKDARNLLLVFQHHTGDIRWMQRAWPDTWQGGSVSESVDVSAKNGTPLSLLATSSSAERKAEWHLFYVGEDSKLRQRSIDNETFSWHAGLLNELDITVLDSEKVGLVTCYYSGPIDDESYNRSSGDSSIRLFVATSETTFEQISWQPGMQSWIVERQWTGFNGHAQPACNGWSPGTVTYVMFVDEDDRVAFYWRDHGSSDENDTGHLQNTWVKASLNIPAVDPEAGLSYGYGGNIFARTSSEGPVLGWNITFDAENTAISGSSLSQVSGGSGTTNTSLASWSIPPDVSADGEYEVLVFYQTEGDDVTVFSGDVNTGDWTSDRLPIVDT